GDGRLGAILVMRRAIGMCLAHPMLPSTAGASYVGNRSVENAIEPVFDLVEALVDVFDQHGDPEPQQTQRREDRPCEPGHTVFRLSSLEGEAAVCGNGW